MEVQKHQIRPQAQAGKYCISQLMMEVYKPNKTVVLNVLSEKIILQWAATGLYMNLWVDVLPWIKSK